VVAAVVVQIIPVQVLEIPEVPAAEVVLGEVLRLLAVPVYNRHLLLADMVIMVELVTVALHMERVVVVVPVALVVMRQDRRLVTEALVLLTLY
jgi:hypothetical protein